jgi:hypothetical protein
MGQMVTAEADTGHPLRSAVLLAAVLLAAATLAVPWT